MLQKIDKLIIKHARKILTYYKEIDGCVFSFREGIAKPDPEIYQTLLYSRTQLIAVFDKVNVLKLRLRVWLIGNEKC